MGQFLRLRSQLPILGQAPECPVKNEMAGGMRYFSLDDA